MLERIFIELFSEIILKNYVLKTVSKNDPKQAQNCTPVDDLVIHLIINRQRN